MLIIFKSRAAAEVIMYKEHIAAVLEMLNKDTHRGVITAAESTHAIEVIEKLIEEDKQARKQSENQDDLEDDLDELEKRKKRDMVTLSARLFPILEMLKMAHKKQENILWGI